MASEPDAPPNLDDITSDELLEELAKRFDLGVLFMRRASPVANGESANSPWRVWGDPIWCQGACHFLQMLATQRALGA